MSKSSRVKGNSALTFPEWWITTLSCWSGRQERLIKRREVGNWFGIRGPLTLPGPWSLWKRKPREKERHVMAWSLQTPGLVSAGWLLTQRGELVLEVSRELPGTATAWSPAEGNACVVMSWAAKPGPRWGLVEWRESWIYGNLEEAELINLYTHHIPWEWC